MKIIQPFTATTFLTTFYISKVLFAFVCIIIIIIIIISMIIVINVIIKSTIKIKNQKSFLIWKKKKNSNKFNWTQPAHWLFLLPAIAAYYSDVECYECPMIQRYTTHFNTRIHTFTNVCVRAINVRKGRRTFAINSIGLIALPSGVAWWPRGMGL